VASGRGGRRAIYGIVPDAASGPGVPLLASSQGPERRLPPEAQFRAHNLLARDDCLTADKHISRIVPNDGGVLLPRGLS
jgi:hypothetical protein